MTYEQIYGIAGINNIEECIKNNIEELEEFKKYSANLKNNNDITNLQNEVDACQKQMYTYYQEDLLNNKLVYFLDSNLKLNVKLKIVLPKDESGSNQIIEKIVAINT